MRDTVKLLGTVGTAVALLCGALERTTNAVKDQTEAVHEQTAWFKQDRDRRNEDLEERRKETNSARARERALLRKIADRVGIAADLEEDSE